MTTNDSGSGVPPAAPGSGFGSVTHETTVRNGVEPRRKQPRRVSPLRAEIPHAGEALASAGGGPLSPWQAVPRSLFPAPCRFPVPCPSS